MAQFEAGNNIALKVPPHQFEATVAFYRDIIGLPLDANKGPCPVFQFGDKSLWIDQVDSLSQAEVWLELQTQNVAEAAAHLDQHGVVRCDEIEPLPDGFDGVWVSSPANIVHLISKGE